MELHQLRYLAAVIDEGSFTAAASKLHVSQSGVSTQVAKLERELGHRLLARGSAVRLTDVGVAVLALAREALESVDAIKVTAAEFADAVAGRVRCGMIVGCAIPGFLNVIADLGRTHPGVGVSLTEDDSPRLQAMVFARELDLALVSFADGGADRRLDVRIVSDERLVAVAAPGHRVDGGSIRLGELDDVLCLPPGTGIRTAYERSCERVGVEPRVAIDASSPQTLLGLARRGAGVAVLTAQSGTADGVRTAVIEDARTHACLGLVSRPDQRSPAARLLLDRLDKALRHK